MISCSGLPFVGARRGFLGSPETVLSTAGLVGWSPYFTNKSTAAVHEDERLWWSSGRPQFCTQAGNIQLEFSNTYAPAPLVALGRPSRASDMLVCADWHGVDDPPRVR